MKKELEITDDNVRGTMIGTRSISNNDDSVNQWNIVTISLVLPKKMKGDKWISKIQILCTLEQYYNILLPVFKSTTVATFELWVSPLIKYPVLSGISNVVFSISPTP